MIFFLGAGLGELIRKSLPAVLRLRAAVYLRAATDKKFREDLWCACSRDILLWFDLFAWAFDPRILGEDAGARSARPFIPYPFQREIILDIKKAIEEGKDRVILKSRDLGLSTIMLLVYLWFFLFRPGTAFLVMSRNEGLVDTLGDPDCLFWKIDYAIERLPAWMKCDFVRHRLKLIHPITGSAINGCASTSDSGRGGRRTSMALDEFAFDDQASPVLRATRDVTKCRLFISTPNGTGNAFYRLWQKNEIPRIRAHWSEHPLKRRGLYQSINGDLQVLDGEPIPGYQYNTDGKLRSPWYDHECTRCEDEREVAQELDCDFAASDHTFFPGGLLQSYTAEQVRPPVHVGEFDLVGREFLPNEDGPLQLWVPLGADGEPPLDTQYVIGADVAAGTGSSNSALSIGDAMTGRKVGEYVNPYIQPDDLAEVAAALGEWFGGAIVIWERQGSTGSRFGKVLDEIYEHLHFEKETSGGVARDPGWNANDKTKTACFLEYRYALHKRWFLNPSAMALEEHKHYIWGPNGHVVHSGTLNVLDPSGAKSNHGDRCSADALCWRAMKRLRPGRGEPQLPGARKMVTPDNVAETKPNCMAARHARLPSQTRREELGGW